jgi:phosphate acyltransferase
MPAGRDGPALSEPPIAAPYTLAVDAMGGDHAPQAIVHGIDISAERHPPARFLLVGDEAKLNPLLSRYRRAAAASTVLHTPDLITADLKPTAALRMRRSSMRLAIDAVAGGQAAGVVSAGNSGALLTLAKIVIKTMAGIDRPAMAAIGPSVRGDVVMLDLGANVACDSRNLVEFAVMGDVFARTVLGLTAPTIGLLNVGSEEGKGDDRVRVAAEVLRESHIGPQFFGFVEGHDIAGGTTDVIVTDGFTGNVALKSTEGTAKLVLQLLRQAFTASMTAKLGYLLARSELERLRELVDPRRYNGAIMVGLNGVVVKSHGGTDGPGFAHAIDVAMDMVVHHFNDRIREGLARLGPNISGAQRPNGHARNGQAETGTKDGPDSNHDHDGPLAAAR